eukprot:TRINITY_DN32169_c0_g1_i1.p1 TRINITY_DN32169_c0_g1~~TRINITY_DN32169_c0_g1_i1.p1  ORF type:complete len:617 (+),score=99.03 TRINITY_DN32169_c0_g1_i1:33-1883(+)
MELQICDTKRVMINTLGYEEAASIKEERRLKVNAQQRRRDALKRGDHEAVLSADLAIQQQELRIQQAAIGGAQKLKAAALKDLQNATQGCAEAAQAAKDLHALAKGTQQVKPTDAVVGPCDADCHLREAYGGAIKSLFAARRLCQGVGTAAAIIEASSAETSNEANAASAVQTSTDATDHSCTVPTVKQKRQLSICVEPLNSEANSANSHGEDTISRRAKKKLKMVDLSECPPALQEAAEDEEDACGIVEMPSPARTAFAELFDAAAVDRFVTFALKREDLRISRETTDPVLRKYKFCNVVPGDDRSSKARDAHVQKTLGMPARTALLASATAVFFGSPEFLDMFRIDLVTPELDAHGIIALALEVQHLHGHAFSDAYRTELRHSETSLGTAYQAYTCQVAKLLEIAKHLDEYERLAAEQAGWRRLVEYWRTPGRVTGLKTFFAKEVLLPLVRTGAVAPHSDNISWSPMGCGAEKGHRRLLKTPIRNVRFKLVELERQLQTLHCYIMEAYPSFAQKVGEKGEAFTAHDCQNVECEYNKYEAISNRETGARYRLYVPWTQRPLAGEAAREARVTQLQTQYEDQIYTLEEELGYERYLRDMVEQELCSKVDRVHSHAV